MKRKTIEIKARCDDQARIRQALLHHQAEFRGTDHQCDTYFSVPEGRLKLREGNIENALIFYLRENHQGPKESQVMLSPVLDGASLKAILMRMFDVKAVVDKVREIYFIHNVKFHLDQVTGLGTFVEIEAIDEQGTRSSGELMRQCQMYMDLFGIFQESLLKFSYSDMVLDKEGVRR